MISEKEFEDIICKYPELIEEGLVFKGRQVRLYRKIIDVLFKDRFGQNLVVELKIGPVDRKHIGQVMEYEGSVLGAEDPTARIMLIGNRVPPNLKKALDHHGIEWKEIPLSCLHEFLEQKKDSQLLSLLHEHLITPKNKEKKDKITSNRQTIASENFPSFINNVYENVIKPISPRLTISKGGSTARYSSIFLDGKNIMHIYDRKPTRVQIHIAKLYLKNNNIKFDVDSISSKFTVRDTKYDYPIIINKDSDLKFLREFLKILYSEKNIEQKGKLKAVDLIYAFDKYVRSNPSNKHNKYLTFKAKDKLIVPLGDIEWDEVENKQDFITEKLKLYLGEKKEPSPRTIELAWRGLYYCYEYGVVKKMIFKNPFRNLLPKKPRTGSLIE